MSHRDKRADRRTGPPTDREAGADDTSLDAYPELHPIRLLAVDAAIYTFGIDVEIESDLVVHLEEAVAAALIATYAPIAAIARETTRVADTARAAHLAAAARTAQVMAIQVAEVAATLHTHDDDSAIKVAQAATDAANLVAATVAAGDEGAAAAVRAIALDGCYQVAISAAATAAEQALTKQATGRGR
jgi:hypothetical protein